MLEDREGKWERALRSGRWERVNDRVQIGERKEASRLDGSAGVEKRREAKKREGRELTFDLLAGDDPTLFGLVHRLVFERHLGVAWRCWSRWVFSVVGRHAKDGKKMGKKVVGVCVRARGDERRGPREARREQPALASDCSLALLLVVSSSTVGLSALHERKRRRKRACPCWIGVDPDLDGALGARAKARQRGHESALAWVARIPPVQDVHDRRSSPRFRPRPPCGSV